MPFLGCEGEDGFPEFSADDCESVVDSVALFVELGCREAVLGRSENEFGFGGIVQCFLQEFHEFSVAGNAVGVTELEVRCVLPHIFIALCGIGIRISKTSFK